MLNIDKKAVEIAKETKDINEIAKLGGTTTDIARLIYINEEYDGKVGDIITNVGIHWADRNDEFGNTHGYEGEIHGDKEVLFFANNVSGYKVRYFNEIWAESNDISYEDELKTVEEYEAVYALLGTDEDLYEECEILVDNDKKFEIVEIYKPNEEENYTTVILEEVK